MQVNPQHDDWQQPSLVVGRLSLAAFSLGTLDLVICSTHIPPNHSIRAFALFVIYGVTLLKNLGDLHPLSRYTARAEIRHA
jgi:hypothetical protein